MSHFLHACFYDIQMPSGLHWVICNHCNHMEQPHGGWQKEPSIGNLIILNGPPGPLFDYETLSTQPGPRSLFFPGLLLHPSILLSLDLHPLPTPLFPPTPSFLLHSNTLFLEYSCPPCVPSAQQGKLLICQAPNHTFSSRKDSQTAPFRLSHCFSLLLQNRGRNYLIHLGY